MEHIRLVAVISFLLLLSLYQASADELQCPTYAEGQQQRSCILTGLSDCRMSFPDCESQAFVLTTSDITARVQDLCCPAGSVNARNRCFKRQRRRLTRAKAIAPIYREKLNEIITGYLTSDLVCGEE